MLNKEIPQIENKRKRTSGFIHISEIIDDVMKDIERRVEARKRLEKSRHAEHYKKRHRA